MNDLHLEQLQVEPATVSASRKALFTALWR